MCYACMPIRQSWLCEGWTKRNWCPTNSCAVFFTPSQYFVVGVNKLLVFVKHMFLLCETLPCTPAAETALQPLIWCSESFLSEDVLIRRSVFSQTPVWQLTASFYDSMRPYAEHHSVFMCWCVVGNVCCEVSIVCKQRMYDKTSAYYSFGRSLQFGRQPTYPLTTTIYLDKQSKHLLTIVLAAVFNQYDKTS